MASLLETRQLECLGDAIIGDRKEQQDAFQAAQWSLGDSVEGVLLCLADGMGGHAGGAVAARLAVNEGINGFLSCPGEVSDRLSAGFLAANQAIKQEKERFPELEGMGCTFLLVAILDDCFQWCSIGDSLIYQVREEQIRRINVDHSLAPVLQDLVDSGDMSQEDADQDPRRNQLRSALIGAEVPLVDLSAESARFDEGDILILASDGVLSIEQSGLLEAVNASRTLEQKALNLLKGARAARSEGLDNTTVLLCRHKVRSGWWPFGR